MPAVRASRPSSARDMWTLRPVTVTVTSLDRAIRGPGREATAPAARPGHRCRPKIRRTRCRSSTPVSHSLPAPPVVSSDGWKRKSTFRGSSARCSAAYSARVRTMAAWASWPQACILPGWSGGIGQAGGLCHRQGVQLRPEGHGVALPRVEPGADAAGDGGEDAAGQRRQDPLHRLHRLRQLIVQLRDAVQGAAVIDHRHGQDLLLVRDRCILEHTIPQSWPGEQGERRFFVSFDKAAGADRRRFFHFFSCQAGTEMV